MESQMSGTLLFEKGNGKTEVLYICTPDDGAERGQRSILASDLVQK